MKYVKNSNIPLICGAVLLLVIGLVIGLNINKKEVYTKVDMVASNSDVNNNNEIEVIGDTFEIEEEQVNNNTSDNSNDNIDNNVTSSNNTSSVSNSTTTTNSSKNTQSNSSNKNEVNNNTSDNSNDNIDNNVTSSNNTSSVSNSTTTTNSSKNTQSNSSNKNDVSNNTEVNTYSSNDEIVINSLESSLTKINNGSTSDSSFSDSAKGVFVSIVDFLFYDGEINGVTFNELTDSGKQKVLEIASKVDNAIESKIPEYKETISDTASKAFNKASEVIKSGANNLNNFAKEKLGEENYQSIIDAKDELVYYTKNAINFLGDVGGKVFNSVKDKLDSWYQDFKN